MSAGVAKMLLQNHDAAIRASLYLKDDDICDWSVWTQDGPSDDTLLVSECKGIAIMESFFGYTFFPLPISKLHSCGWRKIGYL